MKLNLLNVLLRLLHSGRLSGTSCKLKPCEKKKRKIKFNRINICVWILIEKNIKILIDRVFHKKKTF